MLNVRLPVPRFLSAGELFAGKGATAVLRALPATRVVVLASGSLLRNELAGEMLRRSVKAQDVRFMTVPGGEPNLDLLQPLIAAIADFRPDWIIAAGGGSVLDSAKICWAFYEHPDLDLEQATRPFALPTMRGRAKLVALPVTSGSGSEVSSAALFTVAGSRTKYAMVSHELLPDIVILDPALTVGVPADTVAPAGLDALAHAIEGYASRFENSLVDLFAEQAVRTLLKDLRRSVEVPEDSETRLNIMNAAMMAGWVQNLKVPGAGHAIAHQLASLGVRHGAGTGMMLAPAMRYNLRDERTRQKYDRLASEAGLGGAESLIARIVELRAELSAANPLAGKVIADREDLVTAALEDVCARANPRALDREAIHEILDDALCST